MPRCAVSQLRWFSVCLALDFLGSHSYHADSCRSSMLQRLNTHTSFLLAESVAHGVESVCFLDVLGTAHGFVCSYVETIWKIWTLYESVEQLDPISEHKKQLWKLSPLPCKLWSVFFLYFGRHLLTLQELRDQYSGLFNLLAKPLSSS